MSKNILEVKNLNKYYVSPQGINHAVNNVSFSLKKGEVIGLIGQSGSGKTTVGRALMRTLTETNGTINLDGKIYPNFAKSGRKSLPYKKKVQMIYQNPMDSLNGLRNIYSTLEEALDTHHILDESIKSLLKSRNDIKKTYELDFKLLQAELDYKYYAEKQKLVLNHNDKFLEIKNENDIESYLYFEEEKLNKEIIKLLVGLEEKFADAFNEKYSRYLSNKSSSKTKTKLIFAKNSLKKFNENKENLKKFDKSLNEINKESEREIKENLKHIKDNLKLFAETQKKLKSSFKEVSSNQRDIFLSINYKISQLISERSESIFKNILKRISKKTSTETISIEDLNKILEEVTENQPKKLLKITSTIATKESIIGDPKGTLKLIKKSIDDFEYDFGKYIISSDFYISKSHKWRDAQIKKLTDRNELLLKSDLSNDKREELENAINLAKISFEEERNNLTIEANKKIDSYNQKMKDMNIKNDEISKTLDTNAKEAMTKFDAAVNDRVEEVKNQIKETNERAKIKELKGQIKTIKVDAKNKKNKFKVKNQAYDLEKKILTKNIDKIKVICGLQKESLIGAKRQYKEAVVTKRIYNTLKKVGLKPEHAYRYPHEFSGGQLQRVLIARALLVEPDLIIADEPIASLDISIQAQVINLLIDLVRERNISLIFIGHDLSTIEYLCDQLLVMHLGRVVERGKSEQIFAHPAHPYTKTLFKSVPRISEANKKFELFKGINDYLTQWTREDRPSYRSVSGNHEIFANNIQWKAWNGKKTKTASQGTTKIR